MRDDDATTATDAEQDERAEQARLSRAAREAVRHPADPRIDRQLARMGLAPDADDAAEVRNASTTELHELRSAIAIADEVAAETTRRIDRLTLAVSLEAVAIVVLAVLLLLR